LRRHNRRPLRGQENGTMDKFIDELENLSGEIRLSRNLTEIIWELTDHAEGKSAALQNGDYDRLSTLNAILFDRMHNEACKFQEIIEKIYEEKRKEDKKEDGKV
jgi:hypothetical protein